MSVSSSSLDQPPVVIQSTPQTVHPRCSSELNVPSATSSKQNVNHSCSIESNAHSAASSTHNISESSDSITSSSVSLNVPSFLPTTRGDVAPVVNTVDTTLPHNTPVSHKVKPSGSSVPKFHPKDQTTENINLQPKLVINPEKSQCINSNRLFIITSSPTLILITYMDYALGNLIITGMFIMTNMQLNHDTHMYTYIHIFKPTSYISYMTRSPSCIMYLSEG